MAAHVVETDRAKRFIDRAKADHVTMLAQHNAERQQAEANLAELQTKIADAKAQLRKLASHGVE